MEDWKDLNPFNNNAFVMDAALENSFNLDTYLYQLAQSDSSVEYAPHIREEFDGVVKCVNEIRSYLGGSSKDIEEYFNYPNRE